MREIYAIWVDFLNMCNTINSFHFRGGDSEAIELNMLVVHKARYNKGKNYIQ